MSDETPTLQIAPSKSFMQNIMAFAKDRGIKNIDVSKACGVSDGNLPAKNLNKHPYLNFGIMTLDQADSVISLVAPQELHDEFRKLKGYPEKTMDTMLSDLVAGNEELENISDKKFGELLRFNRLEKARDGKYLNISDYAIDSSGIAIQALGTASLSKFELKKIDIWQSQGFAILEKFGYSGDEKGFKDFIQETSKMLAEKEIRKEKFGKALFIHMYPEGKVNNEEKAVTQEDVLNIISSRNNTIRSIFEGNLIPKPNQIMEIIRLFGYEDENSEQSFYQQAEKMQKSIGNNIELNYRPISAEMTKFGKNVEIIRDEMAISQVELNKFIRQSKSEPARLTIFKLENGDRIKELSQDNQIKLITCLVP